MKKQDHSEQVEQAARRLDSLRPDELIILRDKLLQRMAHDVRRDMERDEIE